MARLVDPYGFPVSSRLLQAAEINHGARPYWQPSLRDAKKDIPFQDWRTVVSYSRRLYGNDGLVKGAIDQMAQHAIGRAWNPHYHGQDRAWGIKAQRWLIEEWFPVCDVRGQQWDFKTNLFNDSVALDVDGDFAVVLTETESGFPQTQHIPAHKIGIRDTQEKKVKGGPLRGYTIEQGIILNEFNRIVGLRILGETEADDKDIIANDVIFCFNATRIDQVRGLPSFSHAINELRDAWQSQQWEQITHQLASAISLVEYNDTGGVDPNDPSAVLGVQGTNNETFSTRQYDGGTVKLFKAGTGNKLEEFASSKPGPAWEAFQDRVIRKALVGMGWPYSLTWKSDGLNGPAERSQIELARATIQDRQDLLNSLALREIQWALSKAAKLGRIPESADWWRWSFTVPPKFSIDNGRDGQSRREDYKLGHKNLRGILGEQSIDFDEHRNEREAETVDLIVRAKRIAAAHPDMPIGFILSLLQQQTSTASVGGGVFGAPLGEEATPPTPPPTEEEP